MNINEILQQVDDFYAENRGEEAEQLMLSSIERATAEQDSESLLQLLNELLGYYRETSRVEDSYAKAEQALSLAEKMGLQGTIPYATTLLNVANAYRAGGKLQDSLQCYEQVKEIYDRLLSADNMLVAGLENNKSLLYQEMGDYPAAKKCLLSALEIVKAKEADFEVAVTYANLASTCMQLGEAEAAYTYGGLAIQEFERMGILDFHYGAALAAMGSYYYQKQDFATARNFYAKARDIMEEKLGQNEYYRRLQENVTACEREIAGKTSSDKAAVRNETVKGLQICREYYETYGKPMIDTCFSEYAGKIAVGLVGEGSDCFGYDDEISRDHDWGPDFCLWVTSDTYEQIGGELQRAYEQLPGEYKGYHRAVNVSGAGRRGVMTIDSFFQRLLGAKEMESHRQNPWEAVDWSRVTDAGLAAAVNGEVFRDEEGIFSEIRQKLQRGYPESILYRKLAEGVARFSQTGQYNYIRCRKRGDKLTAQIMLAECVKEAMMLKHYLEGKYPPHDKWLRVSMEQLHGGAALSELLQKLMDVQQMSDKEALSGSRADGMIEEIAAILVQELYAKNYISDTDNYLDAHTEELLRKAVWTELTTEQLIQEIVKLEFRAFDKVQNVGGRADCQNDWPTFYVMRKSQYLTWNRQMLLQYYYDFSGEYERGHNLIEEKYGRMMESTAPEEYARIQQHFLPISPQKQAIIEQIVGLQVGWMEEFAAEYPILAGNARSVHTAEDNLYNTSYETYLRGEISTYSDKMLELYGRYIVSYARDHKNLTYDIMGNSAQMYGYESLEAAERGMRQETTHAKTPRTILE